MNYNIRMSARSTFKATPPKSASTSLPNWEEKDEPLDVDLYEHQTESSTIAGTSGALEYVRKDSEGNVVDRVIVKDIHLEEKDTDKPRTREEYLAEVDSEYKKQVAACRVLTEVFGIYSPPIKRWGENKLAVSYVDLVPVLPTLYDETKIEASAAELKTRVEENERFKRFVDEYKFDLIKQTISHGGVEYKIRGNYFGSNIAALLIGDTDFQPGGANLGFVRQGNHFIVAAIDKDKTEFKGDSYEGLLTRTREIQEDPIYSYSTLDQKLYSFQCIEIALTKGTFDAICPEHIAVNIKKSASSILTHPHSPWPKEKTAFMQREHIRHQLTQKILQELNISPDSSIYFKYAALIMDDLRGRHFEPYFAEKSISPKDLTNKKLLGAAVGAYMREFLNPVEFLAAQVAAKKESYKKHKSKSTKLSTEFKIIEDAIASARLEKKPEKAVNIVLGAIISERHKSQEAKTISLFGTCKFSQLMDEILTKVGCDSRSKTAAIEAYAKFNTEKESKSPKASYF